MCNSIIKEIIKMPYEAKDDTFIVDGDDSPVLSIEYLGKRRFQPSENGRAGYEYNKDAEAFLKFTAAAINEKVYRDSYEHNEDDPVTCFECKHYFVDKKDLDRCKLKGMTVTIDPDVKEPCNGYEHIKFTPLCWQKDIGYHFCPKCKKVFNDERNPIKGYNFCPYCGQRLLPPNSEYIVSETIDGVQTGLIISKESIEE